MALRTSEIKEHYLCYSVVNKARLGEQWVRPPCNSLLSGQQEVVDVEIHHQNSKIAVLGPLFAPYKLCPSFNANTNSKIFQDFLVQLTYNNSKLIAGEPSCLAKIQDAIEAIAVLHPHRKVFLPSQEHNHEEEK